MTTNQSQPEQPPTPAPTKRRRWPWIVGIVAALLLGVGIGASGGEPAPTSVGEPVGGNDPNTPAPRPTVTVTAEPAELAKREQLLDDLQGELDDLSTALDEKVVALEDWEAELDEREAALEQTETEIAANTIPGDGLWIVGEEIEPGTYRSDGGQACYWARLSSTSGEFDAIITNGVPSGPTTVTIDGSDTAFETTGCADWQKAD